MIVSNVKYVNNSFICNQIFLERNLAYSLLKIRLRVYLTFTEYSPVSTFVTKVAECKMKNDYKYQKSEFRLYEGVLCKGYGRTKNLNFSELRREYITYSILKGSVMQ